VRLVRPRDLALALPPLLLAVAGLLHPMDLTSATSGRWLALHVVLIPVFPLLGVCLWVLLRGERGWLAWAARVAAFTYATFYGALDTVNGVAVGVLVRSTPAEQVPALLPTLRPLLTFGNTLGWVGSIAFLVGVLLTLAVLARWVGRRVWPGAVLTVLGAVSFLDSHIYWPRGVLTMLVLAVGFVLLARSRASSQ
jgi:hypothetical protein